jgi:hypothetical protein
LNREFKIAVAVAGIILIALVAFGAFFSSGGVGCQPANNVSVMQQSLTENMTPGKTSFSTVSSINQLIQAARSYHQSIINYGYIERLGYSAYWYAPPAYDMAGYLNIIIYRC